jgi:hypothetical protein
MSPHSAIEWTLARSSMIDHLKHAILGNYSIIKSLAAVLENGPKDKKLLDQMINRCDALVNLREEILMNRVRYTVTPDKFYLDKSRGFLERYFSLLAFCAYVNECASVGFGAPFSAWMKSRPEVPFMSESIMCVDLEHVGEFAW